MANLTPEQIKKLETALKGATDPAIKKKLQTALDKAKGEVEVEVKEEVKEEVKVKETPKSKAKPKKRAKAKAKPKQTQENLAKAKADIKKKTGKTEEECEDIINQYKALRGKAQARKKKETESKEKTKTRVAKEKKEGKIIAGTDVKTASATIEKVKKEIPKKIEKEVKKTETKAKKEEAKKKTTPEVKKRVVKEKVKSQVKRVVHKIEVDTKGLISAIQQGIAKFDKDTSKAFLLKLRSDIDKMLKKYDVGGMVQHLDIQQGVPISDPNVYARGGDVQATSEYTFNELYEMPYSELEEYFKNFWGYEGEDVAFDEIYTDSQFVGKSEKEKKKILIDNFKDYNYSENYARGGKTQGYDDRQDESLGMRTGKESSKKQSDKARREDSYGKWGKRDKEDRDITMARGGKTQGYDDRLDESLGGRHRGKHSQDLKDRRDESKGMEKALGNRPYESVGTMDKGYRKGGLLADKGEFKQYRAVQESGIYNMFDPRARQQTSLSKDKWRDIISNYSDYMENYDYASGGTTGTEFDDYLKKGGTTGTELDDYLARGGTTGTELDDYLARGGTTGTELDDYLARGGSTGTELDDYLAKGGSLGEFDDYLKKGGKTKRWVQKVEDSPDFDKGGFTREAKKRGVSVQTLFNRVMRNPDKYPKKLHQQAVFMKNAYKFKIT